MVNAQSRNTHRCTEDVHSIGLQKEDWCYHRYLWHEQLNPNEVPEEKIIMDPHIRVKSSW